MAVIGVSRAWSPRRSTFPSRSEAAIAAPRLHQVSPTQVDRRVATRTPDSTAPTRTAPILSVEYVDAWTTSSAVNAPVRSTAPSVTTRVMRYEITAADVSRVIVASVGRSRPGTSRHRSGRPGHAVVARRCSVEDTGTPSRSLVTATPRVTSTPAVGECTRRLQTPRLAWLTL